MTAPVKRLIRVLAGDYELYSIYSFDLASHNPQNKPSVQIIEIGTDELDELKADIPGVGAYFGQESVIFAARQGNRYAAACAFLWGSRYQKERNFMPLSATEAKLVQVTTARDFRGRGLARNLIAGASIAMRNYGFEKLHARIWRNHRASEKAFSAAGWEHSSTVVGFRILGVFPRVRLSFRVRR